MKPLGEFFDDTSALSREECLSRRDAEWRRLVEEAQAERDKERAAHDFAADVLKTVQAERDRLKGDLAEARRLLKVAENAVPTDSAIEDQIGAFLNAVATPAEQAQGEGASSSSVTHMSSDIETPTKKTQATGGLLDDVNAQVAALAKRVEALEHEAQEDAKAWADTALTLMNRVTKLEVKAPPPDYAHHHTFRQWEREGWPDRCGVRVREGDAPQCCQPEDWYGHRKAAREAAGPGHAFAQHCHGCHYCAVDGCFKLDSDHAVPPIPGRAR